MKSTSKTKPQTNKQTIAKIKRRFVSDFEVETYWKYYTGGFDHSMDKTPRWWRRLFA